MSAARTRAFRAPCVSARPCTSTCRLWPSKHMCTAIPSAARRAPVGRRTSCARPCGSSRLQPRPAQQDDPDRAWPAYGVPHAHAQMGHGADQRRRGARRAGQPPWHAAPRPASPCATAGIGARAPAGASGLIAAQGSPSPRPIGRAPQAAGTGCPWGLLRPANATKAPWFCGFTRRRPRRWSVATTSAPLKRAAAESERCPARPRCPTQPGHGPENWDRKTAFEFPTASSIFLVTSASTISGLAPG